MPAAGGKTGLWMIGACGGIGSTVALGLAALRLRGTGSAGLVTALPQLAPLKLIDPAGIVLGGHEIRRQTLLEAVEASHRDAGLFDHRLIQRCTPALHRMQQEIRPGTLCGAGPAVRSLSEIGQRNAEGTGAQAVRRLARDLSAFQRRHRLEHVVVVHVASCEAAVRRAAACDDEAGLTKALRSTDSGRLPTSSLYALAAVEAGCSYINFTPSKGIDLPAIRHRAEANGLSYMGRDGKTGETLVKSVLAPLFVWRNLPIRSWSGHNVLGNRDGQILSDPATKAAKIRTKDRVLDGIAGGPVDAPISIEFVRSLNDWKVAWDFIHFQGFLGTKMSMQFIWQGADSVLAAPLVIDLVRLAEHHRRIGRHGPMPHLACFFKAPMEVAEQNYFSQWRRLLNYVKQSAPEARTARRRGKVPS